MSNSHRTCASCTRFPLADAVENGGVAECEGYEKPTHWDDPFCVLYVRANNLNQRRPLVAKLMEKRDAATDESGNKNGEPHA